MSTDPLVGRFFHSFTDAGDVDWQGHVVGRNDRGYVVELFSWWDGQPNGQRLVPFVDADSFRFYETALAMQVARGCNESFNGVGCSRPPEVLVDIGTGPMVFCERCAEFYFGKKRQITAQDLRLPKPTAREVRVELAHELARDISTQRKGTE